MSKRAYIGLDQGSSNSKSVLVSESGKLLGTFVREVETHYLSKGKVEQDPEQLAESIEKVLQQALELATSLSLSVDAIGLSTQRSGVLAWHRDSMQVLHPLLSWRDTRTRDFLESCDNAQELVRKQTGLPLSAHYAAGKISMLQRMFTKPDTYIGTLDSFLQQKLFSCPETEFHTEDSMAHRTMLYSLESYEWDEFLCELFEVDLQRLPEIHASVDYHGSYGEIPLQFLCGDQQSALFELEQLGRSAYLGLGTSALLAVKTESLRTDVSGFIPSIFYSQPSGVDKKLTYLLEGTVNFCGRTVNEIEQRSGESLQTFLKRYQTEQRELPVAYCPFGNTTTPDWRFGLPNMVEAWDGNNQTSLSLALFENLAFSIAFLMKLFKEEDVLTAGQSLVAGGGGSRFEALVQLIADVSGLSLEVCDNQEMSATGAAIGAARAMGVRIVPDVEFDTFNPQHSNDRAKERFQRWLTLRARVHAGQVEGLREIPGL